MTPSRHLYAVIGLVTILSAISLSSSHLRKTPTQTQNVNVVNTPNVNVSSLPAVQMGSGANIRINNTAATPVPVDEDASHSPIRVSGTVPISDGQLSGSIADVYDVPSGYVLIIQAVYGYATLPAGQKVVAASVAGFPVPFTDRGSSNSTEYADGSTTQIGYLLSPGTSVDFSATRSDSSSSPAITVGFIGYLVPVSQINTSAAGQVRNP